MHLMRSHCGGTHLGAEEEEEVGANFNSCASGLGIIDCTRRSDAADIGSGSVALIHDEHRPNFPPTR